MGFFEKPFPGAVFYVWAQVLRVTELPEEQARGTEGGGFKATYTKASDVKFFPEKVVFGRKCVQQEFSMKPYCKTRN